MNAKLVLLAAVVFSVFLLGCASSNDGYATYNQPQGQQPYVGGGCGVAPDASYGDAPAETIVNSQSIPL